jgi:multidrug efflux pump subunit AcrB
MVVNLAGSSQVAPTYWLNPANGVTYPIVMQTPQYSSIRWPRWQPAGRQRRNANAATLGGLARFERGNRQRLVSQYDVQPMVQIHATTQDRDLGAVAADIRKVLAETGRRAEGLHRSRCWARCRRWTARLLRPAVRPAGRGGADLPADRGELPVLDRPGVIVSALPARWPASSGCCSPTHTTLSVPALTGAIMCMGVATANSVLVISFAASARRTRRRIPPRWKRASCASARC